MGDEDAVAAVQYDGGADDFVGDFFFFSFFGKLVGAPFFMGGADAVHGAFPALRIARQADEGAQFHPGFIDGGGLIVQQEGVGEELELAAGGGPGGVGLYCEKAGKNAYNIAVEYSQGMPEGEGGDGCGGIGAQAWQAGEDGWVVGQAAAMPRCEELRGFM